MLFYAVFMLNLMDLSGTRGFFGERAVMRILNSSGGDSGKAVRERTVVARSPCNFHVLHKDALERLRDECELQYKCQQISEFFFENAERVENCPWKMMIFYWKLRLFCNSRYPPLEECMLRIEAGLEYVFFTLFLTFKPPLQPHSAEFCLKSHCVDLLSIHRWKSSRAQVPWVRCAGAAAVWFTAGRSGQHFAFKTMNSH